LSIARDCEHLDFQLGKHAAARQNPRVRNEASKELRASTLTLLRPEENGFLKDELGLDAIVRFCD
jgi:hypothetical protein